MKYIIQAMVLSMLWLFSANASGQEVDNRAAKAQALSEKCVQTVLRNKTEYPTLARLARLEGKSLCKVELDETGHVLNASLLEARNPILDKEALRLLTSGTEFKSDCKQKEVFVAVVFKLH